eukprot:8079092-Pyramimonas_sp.AAC.1
MHARAYKSELPLSVGKRAEALHILEIRARDEGRCTVCSTTSADLGAQATNHEVCTRNAPRLVGVVASGGSEEIEAE